MKLFQTLKEALLCKKLFNKVKKLDTKYFSTLCDNWELIRKYVFLKTGNDSVVCS